MGDSPGLKITIGADVQNAIRGIGGVSSGLDDLGQSSTDFSKRFSDALKTVSDNIDRMVDEAIWASHAIEDGFGNMPEQVKPAIRSINELTESMEVLQSKIADSTDIKEIEALNAEFKKLQTQLNNLKVVTGLAGKPLADNFDEAGKSVERFGHKTTQSTQLARFAVLDFGHVIRDLPYALANPALLTGPIDRTAQLLTEITQTSGGAKNALKAVGSVLAGPGGILIGIELITTAAALLFGNMEHFAEGAKDKLSDYQKTLEEVSKTVGDQAAKATTLFNALESGTLNTQQRKKALKELEEINVEYFGSLKDEGGIIQGLSQAYDNYIKQLETIGRAKAIESQLAKLFDKKLELELKINPQFTAATDPATQYQIGKLKKQLQSLGGEVDLTKLKDQNVLDILDNKTLQQRIDLQKRISDLEHGISYLKDKGYLQAKRQVDLIDLQIKGLSQLQQDTGEYDIKADKGIKGRIKTIDDLLQKIKQVQEELSKPNNAPLFQQLQKSLLPDDFSGISLLRQKIADAIEEGNKIGTDRAKQLAKELGDLYEQQIGRIRNPNLLSNVDFTLANPADVTKISDKLESLVSKEFGKKIDLKIPANIKAELESFDGDSFGISLRKAIQDAGKSLGDISAFTLPIRVQLEKKEIADQLDKQLGEVLSAKGLQKDLAASAANFGESIGAAIASGKNPIVAAGKSILTALGQLIQDIGKNLIEYGIAKQFLDTVLSAGIALPGAVAIGLGIAAEAIGALVKGVGQSYHAFATGGIVTRPTLGLVGEAGPEVIFPLDRLNRFIKGTQGAGAQTVNVIGNISGNNIRLSLARTNKQQGLV